jgi:DNA invertase Pin-like site-specific DNA recombinase
MIYGYARVSTAKQIEGNSFEEQTNAITLRYSNAKMIYEQESGAEERPIFLKLLDDVVSGDMIVVTKLDRFCRTTKEGLEYIDLLRDKGVSVHILNMGVIENTPIGRMIVTNLLAFAEFERAMIKERTQAGKAIARTKDGWKDGRPRVNIEDDVLDMLYRQQQSGKITVRECCEQLGISRATWYNLTYAEKEVS